MEFLTNFIYLKLIIPMGVLFQSLLSAGNVYQHSSSYILLGSEWQTKNSDLNLENA